MKSIKEMDGQNHRVDRTFCIVVYCFVSIHIVLAVCHSQQSMASMMACAFLAASLSYLFFFSSYMFICHWANSLSLSLSLSLNINNAVKQ